MQTTAFHLDPDLIHGGCLPAAPVLRLVEQPARFTRPVLAWFVDADGTRPVPSRDAQIDIVESVFKRGDACERCRHCERDGDGYNEPRTEDCRALAGDVALTECRGYDDELLEWEQDQLDALDDEAFERLTIGGAA